MKVSTGSPKPKRSRAEVIVSISPKLPPYFQALKKLKSKKVESIDQNSVASKTLLMLNRILNWRA